ncbi:MAG: C25 family cysteine peptidase [Candidatus Eisenbacteria bacterium]|nr:C25 family cysteine peptidase [Candidatus Eisenbacteria bacterium]
MRTADPRRALAIARRAPRAWLACIALAILSAASASSVPWTPADGDVLVLVGDSLLSAAGSLLEDLRARGYRPCVAPISTVRDAYPDLSVAEAIRMAVAEAIARSADRPLALILAGTASEDRPERDLVPTAHAAYEHEFPAYYDGTFAEDDALARPPGCGDAASDLLVGRIPATCGADLLAYVGKLRAYREQPENRRLLLLVGDAPLGRDNSDRRRAAAELLDAVAEAGAFGGIPIHASSYMPLSDPGNRARALAEVSGRLGQGIGLLALFGNNTGPADLVHMLACPPGNEPWLAPEEMPTSGRLPIAIFSTCLNGAFDEDDLFGGHDAPVETWVRAAPGGVIAALAPTHLTTFFDDWEICGQLLARLGSGQGPLLGAALAGVRRTLLDEAGRGERSAASVRMCALLGDPLLSPRLGVPWTGLDGSFEPSGAWPSQNALVSLRGWTSADLDSGTASARVATEEEAEGVRPVEGRRLLRVRASFDRGADRRAAAWRLFSCDVEVGQGSVLRGWLRQDRDPAGEGHLALEAITASGRILTEELADLCALTGAAARAGHPLGLWIPIAVRLDEWAGERIREVYLRYEDRREWSRPPLPSDRGPRPSLEGSPLPAGEILAYVDAVRIERTPCGVVLDPSFRRDDDRDGRPDDWNAPWPACRHRDPPSARRMEEDREAEAVEVWLDGTDAERGGLSQSLGDRMEGCERLYVDLEATGTAGSRLAIRLRDSRTGAIVSESILGPLEDEWFPSGALLDDAAGERLLELRAFGGAVALRRLLVTEEDPERGLTDPTWPGRGPQSGGPLEIRVEPNPARSGELRVCWSEEGAGPQSIEVFDAGGRLSLIHI